MVYGPDRISGVAQTRSRTKMGTIYHNITYIPEDVRVYDAPNGPDPYRILTEEVAEWRQGKYVGHGPTLCLISIDLLARQVASVLGL
ncbi:MAG: hypothetical protein FJY85_11115 [Deltaproteobacteria bacterium]|nr:hypothetical protein [Deltaproteobacteria bacterium]